MHLRGKISEVHEEARITSESRWDLGKTRKYIGLETKISSRNQITIPRGLMREFNLRSGDRICFAWLTLASRKPRITAEVLRNGQRIMTIRIIIRSIGTLPALTKVDKIVQTPNTDGNHIVTLAAAPT